MAGLLTQAERDYLAQRAHWLFDVTIGYDTESAVYAGDGADDLDSVSGVVYRGPLTKLMVDVGVLDSAFKPCNLDDISGIRYAYVHYHGSVNKPPLHEDLVNGAAIENDPLS